MDQVLAACSITPALNQVELHPQLQQGALRAACGTHGIVVEAYSPLGAIGEIQRTGEITGRAVPLFEQPAVKAIALRAGEILGTDVSAAELLLRWSLQKGNVVVTKSSNRERIAAAAKLPPGDLPMEAVLALDRWGDEHPLRMLNPKGLNGVDTVTPHWP